MSEQLAIGVVFGGRSVEHEVSVITAQQAMAALPRDRFRPVPIYIAKSGAWYTGDVLLSLERFRDIGRLLGDCTRVALRAEPDSGGNLFAVDGRRGLLGGQARIMDRIDVAMPLVHGSHGEDGTLAGLFELCDVAYTGCDVAASAVSMDKPLARAVFRSAGLPVLEGFAVERSRWHRDRDAIRTEIQARLGFPMYVKPRSLGSSIGVSRVESDSQLAGALDVAMVYDSWCIIEPAQDGIVEINCSVLGRGDAVRASVCEQPVSGGLLSYADKYLSKSASKPHGSTARAAGMKGAKRLIPAPLSESLTKRVQEAAVTAFRSIGAEGVARVDFLVRPDDDGFIVNEINTVPGSLSFYLWEPSGVPFASLLGELIALGMTRHHEKRGTNFSIDTWLLSGRSEG